MVQPEGTVCGWRRQSEQVVDQGEDIDGIDDHRELLRHGLGGKARPHHQQRRLHAGEVWIVAGLPVLVVQACLSAGSQVQSLHLRPEVKSKGKPLLGNQDDL